jgi:hypothetical protein
VMQTMKPPGVLSGRISRLLSGRGCGRGQQAVPPLKTRNDTHRFVCVGGDAESADHVVLSSVAIGVIGGQERPSGPSQDTPPPAGQRFFLLTIRVLMVIWTCSRQEWRGMSCTRATLDGVPNGGHTPSAKGVMTS